MKRLLAVLIGSTLLTSTALAAPDTKARPTAAQTAPQDAAFKAIYTREWAWRQEQFKGEDGEDSVTGVADRLPHVDAATQERQQHYWEDVLKRLAGIKESGLSREARTNFLIYRAQIQALVDAQRFRDYEKPLNADTTFWTNLAGGARKPFAKEAEYRAYLKQLQEVPRYFDEEIANMRAGLARGFTPPRVTLEGRDSTLTSVTEAKSPEDTVYYTPFKTMPATIPAATQAALREQARVVIAQSVVPAYARVLSFLRTQYIPGARTELAAEKLPDGAAYYQSKIKEFTTLDLTPDQIHKIGLDEVARLRARMQDVIREVGFQGDFPAFLHFLRTDPQFYAKTPDELLKDAAWIAKEFDGKAEQYFGYLPRKRFAIIPVPADLAPFYTAGRGGPGVYLVNTYQLDQRPLYSLPALTLHESAPGHAFQMPISMEQKDQPEFRTQSYISAFGEGWALYCENLGEEMGMYKTPYERFGMLSYQIWRASRLVVDTGIHHLGWTREQAQAYLHDNTALPDHEIETEVDRYISWPGQALSYYLGEMDILKNRAKAEQALGQNFNIRAFHDTVLKLGSVPLPVLDDAIDQFIKDGGKEPYPDLK